MKHGWGLATTLAFFATSAFGQSSDIAQAAKTASRIAAAWQLPFVEVQEVAGSDAEFTAPSTVRIGRGFIDRLPGEPRQREVALTFVILHELWHAKQRELFAERADVPALKPVLECQADLMAATAYTRDRWSSGSIGAGESLRGSPRSADFRSTWPIFLNMALAQGTLRDHLSDKQRAMSLQLGLQRGMVEGLRGIPNLPEQLRSAVQLLEPFADNGDSADVAAWSWDTCERIVGYDGATQLKLDWDSVELAEDGDGSPDNSWAKFTVSVVNNADRPIRASLSALSGLFPDGKEDKLEHYTFTGIATNTISLSAGEKKLISGRLRMKPDKADNEEWFVWTVPPVEDVLLSARFLTPEVATAPKMACSERWQLASGGPLEGQLEDLAQLGDAARDRFKNILGTVIDDNITGKTHRSTLNVRGALDTQLFPRPPLQRPPYARVRLYAGASETLALQAYREAVFGLRRYCDVETGELREAVSQDGTPFFTVARFTPGSTATLYVLKIEGVSVRYSVVWVLERTGSP